ncbi:MAG TPA: outer membrane beta-barrel protein [Labilithrix sp.]
MRSSRVLFFFFAAIACVFFVAPHARAQMSDTDRKAAARAAYTEGVALQDQGKPVEALAKFETAQKLFDAPTHQLHIAECLSLTGKLVESGEAYESLVHRNLGASPPEAFVQAQEQAKAELPGVQARIPHMRITVKPDPQQLQNLQITLNGTVMPNELVGIARPVNPGPYRINAAANGYRLQTPVELTLAERDPKSDPRVVELTLTPSQNAGGAIVVPPPPPPYGGEPPPPPPNPDQNPPKPVQEGSSSTGLLVGPRVGLLIPGGGLVGGGAVASGTPSDVNMDSFAATGAGLGLDVMARFARLLLVGGTLEFGSLSKSSNFSDQIQTNVSANTSQSTFYIGANLGIVPNIDRVSFYGELGVGLRSLNRTVDLPSGKLDETFSGVEGKLGAGLMIPAGHLIRIVPEAALNIGSFGTVKSNCGSIAPAGEFIGQCFNDGSVSQTATHTLFWIGMGIYFNADLGKK